MNPHAPPLDVVSICPFPAGGVLWEAQPGQQSLTVIVKGTFALVPGEVTVASEQDDLHEERHWDQSPMASVHWPGDFAPSKRRADVTLVGHAYAPRGEPATSLVASLTVGELVKAVRVTGDRAWTLGPGKQPEPGPPSPFLRMPLRYERAALSADNPIGIDVHAPPGMAMPAMPNLELVDPAEGVQACFGPVSPTWRARRKLLDEAATFWAHGVARDPRAGGPPLGAAPPRFDFAFFNAAPPDQQLDLLRPGTPLVLEGLHPRHPHLATKLPAIRPQVFRVPPPGAARTRVEEIILRCDSLWIDTDRAVAVLSWRGVADVGAASEVGRLVVAADQEGKKLRWDRVEKWLGEHGSTTVRLGPDGSFREEPEPPPIPDPLARRHDAVKGAPQAAPAPDAGMADAEVQDEGTLDAGIQDAPTNPLEQPPLYPLSRPIPDEDRITSVPEPPRAPAVKASPRRGMRAPVGSAPEDESAETLEMRRRPVAPRAPEPLAPEPVAPPPLALAPTVPLLGGPLPIVPPPAAPQPRVPPATVPPPAVPPPAAKAAAPRPRAPTGLNLRKDLTIQRYAEISAALAQKGAARAGVLRAHLLTEPGWALVDQTWKKNIAAEAAEGGRALGDAFDEAYVAHQERLGRPIDLAAYARLQVAVERGAVGQVLAELELELGDLVRLQRVWARRTAESPELAARLAHAVEEARR